MADWLQDVRSLARALVIKLQHLLAVSTGEHVVHCSRRCSTRQAEAYMCAVAISH